MWSLCTKCDPCAQNVIPMHKNVIPVHKIPNTKKLYQLQSLSLSLQTPAIPPAVQLYTDNSDFATVTQLPISTIVWNRWVKTSRLSTSNSSIVGTIMQRNRIEPELYHNQSTKHNLTLSSSSRGTKPINLLFLLSYKHQAYDTDSCSQQSCTLSLCVSTTYQRYLQNCKFWGHCSGTAKGYILWYDPTALGISILIFWRKAVT